MREIFIAIGLVGALVVLAALLMVAWESLFTWGMISVAVGMVFGVPTGFVYHVQLYRSLKAKQKLPRGWIWKPFEHHVHLDGPDKLRVLPWGYIGGLGFLVIVFGQVLLVSAIIKAYLAG